jgi:hypothetical protein
MISPTSELRETATQVHPPRLGYLLAASHSGSTLLAMLLGAHDEAATVGELKANLRLGEAEKYRCSCRELITQCPFWAKINAAMAEQGIPDFTITQAGTSIFDVQSKFARRLLKPLHRGSGLEAVRDSALLFSPAWQSHLRRTKERNLALIKSVQKVTGAKVVIDSSKVALRLKYLRGIQGLDIKVIRTIRDGRAVSLTYIDDWNFADSSDPSLRNGGTGQHRPSVRQNMRDAANEWRRSNEAADAVLEQMPRSQWTEVRYEEVCADPKGTLRRLSAFLGLDPDKINLNFRARQQHVIGNGMRLDTTSEIRLDERWKSHLSKEDLQTFDEVAGDLNRKYGYN